MWRSIVTTTHETSTHDNVACSTPPTLFPRPGTRTRLVSIVRCRRGSWTSCLSLSLCSLKTSKATNKKKVMRKKESPISCTAFHTTHNPTSRGREPHCSPLYCSTQPIFSWPVITPHSVGLCMWSFYEASCKRSKKRIKRCYLNQNYILMISRHQGSFH